MSSLFVQEETAMPWLDGFMALQPIVPLGAVERPHGFEALARPAGADIEQVIADASARGDLFSLEASLLQSALSLAPLLPPRAKLFVNVHPATFEEATFARVFLRLCEMTDADPRRVVIEITEQTAFRNAMRAFANASSLRNRGIDLALDDVTAGGAHLDYIAALAPAYLKIGRDVGTDFELDPVKCALVSSLARIAVDAGARLIIEGVESAATAAAARSFGAPFAQGFHFARPLAPALLFGHSEGDAAV